MTFFISVPDDYNQIEEKDEKKNFVNSLWADSANNPVMSSKLICVFQTENQQSKSEVRNIGSKIQSCEPSQKLKSLVVAPKTTES